MNISSASATAVAESAPASSSRETRLITSLVVGALLTGALLEHVIPTGPWTLVAASGLAGAVLATLAVVQKGKLRSTIAGFRFVAVLLIALAIAAMLGTLILQGKPAEFYETRYAAVAPLILALNLDDLFHSLWFAGLLALFGASVVVSSIIRWPTTVKNAGFFACHLGLMLSLVGAALSATLSVKGRIDLHAGGETATKVGVTKAGVPTGAVVPLGFDLRLDRFEVVHYNSEFRLGYYEENQGKWRLKASFDPDLEKHRLPGGDSFRLKAIFPDYAPVQKVVPSQQGGVPALAVTVDGQQKWLMPGERVDSADGKVAVLFDVTTPTLPQAQERHLVTVAGGATVALVAGKTETLSDGTKLKLVRFVPHFTYDVQTRQAVSASNDPKNPAVEVEVAPRGAAPSRRWLFANMPEFNHGNASGPSLSYAYQAGGKQVETAVLVAAADRSVQVKRAGAKAKGPEALPYSDGLEIAPGAKLGTLLPQATRIPEHGTRSQEWKNPAVLVEVKDGDHTHEQLLVAFDQAGMRLHSGGAIAFEKREDEVKAFKSDVTALAGTTSDKATISVNDPMRFNGWTLYQVNYNPNDPSYSGLEAVKDPGVVWVFTGFALISLGVCYMFYVETRLKRRRQEA